MNTLLKCPKRHVIACDLDDSLVAVQSHPEQLRGESDEALHQIGSLVTTMRGQGEVVHFGSATGRTFASIQELAAERPAFAQTYPTMNFHIASVGSAIYARQNGASNFMRIPSWPKVDLWNRKAIVDQLSAYPNLTPQEPAAQEEYKISYLTTSRAETTEHAAQLRAHLGAAGLLADVIVSGHHAWRFVDVLPADTNKGSALLQLPQLLHSNLGNDVVISEHPICRVAAGDSMNDQAVLAVADVAIIPANGQPDLLRWAEHNQLAGSLYVADKQFAAGVLQGLQRHLFGN